MKGEKGVSGSVMRASDHSIDVKTVKSVVFEKESKPADTLSTDGLESILRLFLLPFY